MAENSTFLDDADRPFVQRRRAGVVKDLLANARMLVDSIIAVSRSGRAEAGEAAQSGGLLPSCSQELTNMILHTISVGGLDSGKVMVSAHIRRASGASTNEQDLSARSVGRGEKENREAEVNAASGGDSPPGPRHAA